MSHTASNNYLFIASPLDFPHEEEADAKAHFTAFTNNSSRPQGLFTNPHFHSTRLGVITNYAKGRWLLDDEEMEALHEWTSKKEVGEFSNPPVDEVWLDLYSTRFTKVFITDQINAMSFTKEKRCAVALCDEQAVWDNLGTFANDPQPRRVIDCLIASQLLFRQSVGHYGVKVNCSFSQCCDDIGSGCDRANCIDSETTEFMGLGGWEIIQHDLIRVCRIIKNDTKDWEKVEDREDRFMALWTNIRANEWLELLSSRLFDGRGEKGIEISGVPTLYERLGEAPLGKEGLAGQRALLAFFKQLPMYRSKWGYSAKEKRVRGENTMCRACDMTFREVGNGLIDSYVLMTSNILTDKGFHHFIFGENNNDLVRTIIYNRTLEGTEDFMGEEYFLTYAEDEIDGSNLEHVVRGIGKKRGDFGKDMCPYSTNQRVLNDYTINRTLAIWEQKFKNVPYFIVSGDLKHKHPRFFPVCFYNREEAEECYYSIRSNPMGTTYLGGAIPDKWIRAVDRWGNTTTHMTTNVEERERLAEVSRRELARLTANNVRIEAERERLRFEASYGNELVV